VYAVGGHIEAPWNTYLPTPDARRFFGKPEEYADLFAFVRGTARYLDSYEDAYACALKIVIRKPTGTVYHLRVAQEFTVEPTRLSPVVWDYKEKTRRIPP
jgi:hypothetical protein